MGLISRVSSRTYRSFYKKNQKLFSQKKQKWPKADYTSEVSSPDSEVALNNNTRTKPSSNSKASTIKKAANGTSAKGSLTFTNPRRTLKWSTARNQDLGLCGVRL